MRSVLQMTGAKDPDEYVLKYGSARFQKLLDNAISLIEFKIKVLQQNLNLENSSDKIKFLNEIAKLISKIDNTIEREIYIEKISKGYNISKIIYAMKNNLNKFRKEQKDITEEIYKFGYLFSITNVIIYIGTLYFTYHG